MRSTCCGIRNFTGSNDPRSANTMPGLADKFAVNLKSERLRRKLSQEALAAKAGLSVSYISMLERGQRTPPLDTLESLAKALAVAPTSLLS
jgi:ribosome-binding protein aMBF1 (putative translation factor)